MSWVSIEGTPPKLELLQRDRGEKLRGDTLEKLLLYPLCFSAPSAFVPEQWQCVQLELNPCRVAICFKKEDERGRKVPVSKLPCDYVACCANSLLIFQ